ncbi:MAG: hypothetical protein K8I82_07545, partial [Anaerolineae bacterium]|nr:hypothetical protein [Anaerolineae bacterium]
LYTSPHLHSFRERFRINGELIAQAEFIDGVTAIHQDMPDYPFSTLERATTLAFWWFAQQQIDIAVLEVSLGGRWDAVNVAPNTLAIFTPIESEHLLMLGGSLAAIAWQKAGIIQPDGQAITHPQITTVMDILEHEAKHKNATLHVNLCDASNPQQTAFDLAVAARENLLKRSIITPVYAGIIPTLDNPPGRLEYNPIAGHTVLIDSGHTPLAAQALRAAIDSQVKSGEKVRLVIGLLKDKIVRDYLTALDAPNYHVVLTRAAGHRGLEPDKLAAQITLTQATVEVVPDLHEALGQLHTSEEALFVVGGSLRMAAAAREVYGLLNPEATTEAQATRRIFEGDDYLKKMDRSST